MKSTMIHSKETNNIWLKKELFSNDGCRINLKKGETLMNQGDFNERLFYIESGQLSGYIHVEEGESLKIFTTYPKMIVGIYSFFARDHSSHSTVKADEDTVIYFVHQKGLPKEDEPRYADFLKHMLPVVVNEIYLRQLILMDNAREKQSAMKKLMQTEKLATLGQLSAGLAHELNNAIGVIQNKTLWLTDHLRMFFGKAEENSPLRFFDNGLVKGQTLSSSEIRARKKRLMEQVNLDEKQAKRLAKMDMTEDELTYISKRRSDQFIDQVNYFWETGLAIHDIGVAAKHTSHVIRSIKELGSPNKENLCECNISESIKNGLSLLTSLVKSIEIDLDLDENISITANEGKLIQVWVNIVKNATESLMQSQSENPIIMISAKVIGKNYEIKIRDNGPGIEKELLPTIFQPNVTTKVSGISFGLGLGLSIVQRIIVDLGGTIEVKSDPGNTEFNIVIPK